MFGAAGGFDGQEEAIAMNAKAAQRERSHEAILRSAARLVRERGIAGARVADVMRGAALTVGGFYAHFPSKKALVDETLRRTSASLRGGLFDGLEREPPADRADILLRRYLSAAHRDETALGCPLPAVVGEIATRAPQHRAVLAQQIQALAGRMAAHLPAGARPLSLGLVALMVGGLSLSRALRGTAASDDVLRACRALGAAALRGARSGRP